MRPADINSNTFIDFNKIKNKNDPKFKVSNHVIKSSCKNIFTRGYTSNRSEEVLWLKKLKKTVSWTYSISDLNGEENAGAFYEYQLQKTNPEEFKNWKSN